MLSVHLSFTKYVNLKPNCTARHQRKVLLSSFHLNQFFDEHVMMKIILSLIESFLFGLYFCSVMFFFIPFIERNTRKASSTAVSLPCLA